MTDSVVAFLLAMPVTHKRLLLRETNYKYDRLSLTVRRITALKKKVFTPLATTSYEWLCGLLAELFACPQNGFNISRNGVGKLPVGLVSRIKKPGMKAGFWISFY